LINDKPPSEIDQLLEQLIELLALTENAASTAAAVQKGAADSCPICYESLGSRRMASPNTCDHVFHLDCLENWMNRNIKLPTCPMCRKVFERPAMYA
jgi:hypothetical protein